MTIFNNLTQAISNAISSVTSAPEKPQPNEAPVPVLHEPNSSYFSTPEKEQLFVRAFINSGATIDQVTQLAKAIGRHDRDAIKAISSQVIGKQMNSITNSYAYNANPNEIGLKAGAASFVVGVTAVFAPQALPAFAESLGLKSAGAGLLAGLGIAATGCTEDSVRDGSADGENVFEGDATGDTSFSKEDFVDWNIVDEVCTEVPIGSAKIQCKTVDVTLPTDEKKGPNETCENYGGKGTTVFCWEDTDNDGQPNELDDGDEVPYGQDGCPVDKGSPENHGCPDNLPEGYCVKLAPDPDTGEAIIIDPECDPDEDDIYSINKDGSLKDKCPDDYGYPEFQGCETQEKLDEALAKINETEEADATEHSTDASEADAK